MSGDVIRRVKHPNKKKRLYSFSAQNRYRDSMSGYHLFESY